MPTAEGRAAAPNAEGRLTIPLVATLPMAVPLDPSVAPSALRRRHAPKKTTCTRTIVARLVTRHATQNIVNAGLVLTGGCALNVKANQRLFDTLGKTHFTGVHVPAAPNDAGLGIGHVLLRPSFGHATSTIRGCYETICSCNMCVILSISVLTFMSL